MMRSLFAATAAVLVGVGAPSAQAQCAKCARATPVAGRVATPAAAAPATAQHHVAAGVAAPPLVAFAPTKSEASSAPDDKTGGGGKPAAKADKEVTLTGTLVCAKCGLKEAGVKKCTNALQVKQGDATVTYYLDDKGSGEAYHEGLCGGGTKAGAKVTGVVSEKDGKRWVKATKVDEKQ